MNIIQSKISPQAWNEKYSIDDFSGTECNDECSVKWRMSTKTKDPLWIEVGYCIASNYFAGKETNAPKSKVKTQLHILRPYVEYANIVVIDRSIEGKNLLVLNTLTGESFE